jgi:hypothetical protein
VFCSGTAVTPHNQTQLNQLSGVGLEISAANQFLASRSVAKDRTSAPDFPSRETVACTSKRFGLDMFSAGAI